MKKKGFFRRLFTFKKFLIFIAAIIILFILYIIGNSIYCVNNNEKPYLYTYEVSVDEKGNILRKYKGIFATKYMDENSSATLYNTQKYIPKIYTIEAAAVINRITKDYIYLDILGADYITDENYSSDNVYNLPSKPLCVATSNNIISNYDYDEYSLYEYSDPNISTIMKKAKIKNNNYNYLPGTYLKLLFKKEDIDFNSKVISPKNISLCSFDDLKITFKETNDNNKVLILNPDDYSKYNYDNNFDYKIYKYNGEPYVILNNAIARANRNKIVTNYNDPEKYINKKLDIAEAISSTFFNPNYILAKANHDASIGKINYEVYKDGGTALYRYPNYTIIKYNSLDGKNDLVIGDKEMTIQDLEK